MYSLFKKDLKLFFSDKRAVLLTFLLPLILISLFAFAFGGGGGGSSKPIDLLVADLDNSVSSAGTISHLDSLPGLRIVEADFDKAKDHVVKGEYAALLIFHQGFEDSINLGKEMPTELMYDEAREMEVGMLQPVLMNGLFSQVGQKTISSNIETYMDKNFPDIDDSISQHILEDVNANNSSSNFNLGSSIKMTSIVGEKKEGNLGVIQAVAGTAIMMLLFSVAAIGASMLEEKENGTLKRLLCSPIKSSHILYGKMVYAFTISIVQLSIMFCFAWLVFDLNIFTNVPALILMVLSTAFAVSSFGILLASLAETRQQAQGMSMLIILIMSAIGGSMIPLFLMPAIMKKVAIFSINYWGIEGFFDIFWRELPLFDILPRVLVLTAMGFLITLVSVRLFHKRVAKLL